MSRRSDTAEHSSEARQYLFKDLGAANIQTGNKFAESEVSSLNDRLSDTVDPKGKGAVFRRLFKKTPKKVTSLAAQEVEPQEKLSLQDGELSASKHHQTETHTKKEPVFKNEDFPASDSHEENSLFNFLKTFPRGTEDTSGEDSPPLHIKLLASNDHLLHPLYNNVEDNSGKLNGTFRSSPKPALRFAVETDPLSEHSELTDWDYTILEADKKSIEVPRKCTASHQKIYNRTKVSYRVKRTLSTMSQGV